MRRYRIKFMSPERAKALSSGEVTEYKLVNTRTGEPVKGGLFCPTIFGPEFEFQCDCKVQQPHLKLVDKQCPRCRKKAKPSSERWERFGHIYTESPLLHPLAVKILGSILRVNPLEIEGIINGKLWFEVVPDATGALVLWGGQTYKVVISEKRDYKTNRRTSSLALYALVQKIDPQRTYELHKKMLEAAEKDASRRSWAASTRFMEDCLTYGLRLTDLFITHLLVLPPNLRRLSPSRQRAEADNKNKLYMTLLIKKQRLGYMLRDSEWKKLAPEICYPLFTNSESAVIQQEALKLLIDGSFTRHTPIKSLLQDLTGKEGLLRNKILGKRVDYSGRTVITPGPHLTINEVGIPRKVAVELFKPWIISKLMSDYRYKAVQAAKIYKRREPLIFEILEEVVRDKVVIMNRQPTLHRMGMFCFDIRLHDGHSVLLHPMVCAPFNADFDGDQMAIHVPIRPEALEETKRLMYPGDNLLSPADSAPIIAPSHEMVIGAHNMTKIRDTEKPYVCQSMEKACEAYDRGLIRINSPVDLRTPARFGGGVLRTCVGRLLIGEAFQVPVTGALTKKSLKALISDSYGILGKERLVAALDYLKTLAYQHVSTMGFSLGIDDFVIPSTREALMADARQYANDLAIQHKEGRITNAERKERKIRKWMETIEEIQKDFFREAGEDNPLVVMLKTGARVSMTQVSQLVVAKGMQAKSGGGIIEDPIENCTRTKLNTFEFFVSCYGARKSMADKIKATPLSGYLARRLVNAARDLYISEEDCGHWGEGVEIRRCDAHGRTNALTGEIYAEPSTSQEYVLVRSPIFCRGENGICAACYGLDFSKRERVTVGTPVGIIAAQSLTEPCTQMTMRTFHTSGAAELKDSPLVIYAERGGKVLLKEEGDNLTNIYIERDRYMVHTKLSRLLVSNGQSVNAGEPLAIYTSKSLKNEDIGGKLVLLELYFEARTPRHHAAVIAKEAGVVTLFPDEEGEKIVIHVNGEEQGLVKDTPVFVHTGQKVRKGQFLSFGEAVLKEYQKDLACAANIFVQRMTHHYETEGIKPASVHLEMIFRAMTEFVCNNEGTYGDNGNDYGLFRFREPGERVLHGVTDIGVLYPSWLKAVGFGHTKEGLMRAVSRFAVSRDLPSERIMYGAYPLFDIPVNKKE